MSADEQYAGAGSSRQESGGDSPVSKPLTPQARRALDEAEARRLAGTLDPRFPPELKGRKGPEPVRYGDWEKDGIAVDF